MTRSPCSLRAVATVLLAAILIAPPTLADEPSPAGAAVPMIHVSDLFRPHNDPDDHWDLACVYALAYQGKFDLRGILIDYPMPERENDPDVLAVAQLNYLTGLAVPTMVGSPRPLAEDDEEPAAQTGADLRGVRAMLDMLRRAPAPVAINVIGSCRDVALAGKLQPDLFARKCRAVYLNAGSGTPDPAKAEQLEWNVRLDPAAYAAIFDLPCPVYWLPCFEQVRARPRDLFQLGEYGSFYRFHQGDVLPHLSPGVQRFFAYAFAHGRFAPEASEAAPLRPDWLHAIQSEPAAELLQRINALDRNMWCTAGFLHAAGLAATREGRIVPLGELRDPLYTFDPVEVTCSPQGVTHWQPAEGKANRFLFHVRELESYPAAMTAALKSLLQKLP